jgi:MIP family channel proteins
MGALIAEFIGTFALVFFGAGAIINGQAGLVGVALAHGLTIAVFGSALGAVSGGHFNPAVTLALLTTGRIKASNALGYIVSQCLGATVAAVLLNIALPADAVTAANLGTPLLAPNISLGGAIILEAIATFALVTVIMGTAVDARGPKVGALFIGFTVALDILAIGPLTGAAMNPARSIGPALIGGHLENFWVYWVGPIVGGIAAAVLYDAVMGKKEPA